MSPITPDAVVSVGRRILLRPVVLIVAAGAALMANQVPVPQATPPHGLDALLSGSGFVQIRPGEFLMGSSTGVTSEGPVHRVRITRGFELGKLEVTQAQWDAVMGSAHPTTDLGVAKPPPAYANPSYFRGPTLPVERVSWNDVQRFMATMNARDSHYTYRLPTEAEWEYASRGGTVEESIPDLMAFAWFKANSLGQTQPVGQKRPNSWGLYDMHGNVSEWVQDWYGSEYYVDGPSADPPGPETGSYRVFRGCNWFGSVNDCRSALRLFNFPIDGYYNVGFRLVRIQK